MKNPVVRWLVAIVGGVIAAAVVVTLVETVSALVYPVPENWDRNDRAAFANHVANMPPAAFAFVLGAWTAGAFLGVWLATRVARSAVAGVVVALLFLGACVANLVMLPHPTWFWAAGIVLVLVSAGIALRLGTTARTMRAA